MLEISVYLLHTMALLQWRDAAGVFAALTPGPGFSQLILMERRPFENPLPYPCAEITLYPQGAYHYLRICTTIDCVKMRWRVFPWYI